ncbi:thiamine pyrophosphate-binding protein [Simiduia curdlanivorans]|uniref:Thiamine pyrophosphate-binding protein n=1 Tax=Simiduia curdlanivorans TaxID=1492769 RepID=A0ABV8V1E7_9GAMM|nr:thiamine pyrophosphate-binding protein [Simiduia curdlanivorans]MDN3639223.1 thiamine pyrophosphate-binding protein [Simiduia curdlanivorans]
MNLVNVLEAELKQFGVERLFGIPGDFILPLFEALQRNGNLPMLHLSHEPSIVFAADACARLTNKPSAVLLTYGAGALNAVNAIAQSYVEHVPLIVIAGFPAQAELDRKLLIHHQAKTIDSQQAILREVTCCQVRLNDAASAGAEIRKALVACAELSRPVLIEFPRDAVNFETQLEAPYVAPVDDAKNLQPSVDNIWRKLSLAKRPVILAGVDVRRFNAVSALEQFASAAKIPIISTLMARACLDSTHPMYGGIFLDNSDALPYSLLADADLIVLAGVIKTDSNFAAHGDLFCAEKVVELSEAVYKLDGQTVEGLSLKGIFEGLNRHAYPLTHFQRPVEKSVTDTCDSECAPNATQVVKAMHTVLTEQDEIFPIISDVGDCLFASLEANPRYLLAPAFYASMGYAVPAAFGVQASAGLRPIVLVGDGAFQMTGMELGHCSRNGFSPIVILFNNKRWDMIRAFSPDLHCTDLGTWDYPAFAESMGGSGVSVDTEQGFVAAFQQALARREGFSLIEVKLAQGRTARLDRFATNFLAANKVGAC